jgi:hypothetical protein
MAYVGPGDVVSGAKAWWGLRAYSTATAGNKAVRLIRASDSSQQDFNTLASGGIDIASITSFLASTTAKVVTLYDQTASGFDATQATGANRPAFALAFLNGWPTIDNSSHGNVNLATSASLTQAQSFMHSSFARDNTAADVGVLFGSISGVLIRDIRPNGNAGAGAIINAGSDTVNVAWSNNAWHATQNTFSGAASEIYVDGTGTTVSPGTNGWSGTINLMAQAGVGSFPGYAMEMGIWPGTWNSTQKSNMNSNQQTWWSSSPPPSFNAAWTINRNRTADGAAT